MPSGLTLLGILNVAIVAIVAGFFWSAGCWLFGKIAR